MPNSSIARGGAMGHLHPPRQNCYALDRWSLYVLLEEVKYK